MKSAPPWISTHCIVRKEFYVGAWKGVTEELYCSQQSKAVGDLLESWLCRKGSDWATYQLWIICSPAFPCNMKNKTADFSQWQHFDCFMQNLRSKGLLWKKILKPHTINPKADVRQKKTLFFHRKWQIKTATKVNIDTAKRAYYNRHDFEMLPSKHNPYSNIIYYNIYSNSHSFVCR